MLWSWNLAKLGKNMVRKKFIDHFSDFAFFGSKIHYVLFKNVILVKNAWILGDFPAKMAAILKIGPKFKITLYNFFSHHLRHNLAKFQLHSSSWSKSLG